ncbi:PIG-L deacetylase family protein [Streptomyces sp. MW-W600-10]|uniref:PIG-L deacetylase family protein n=1 Tax=Streptomyces sp. MW-W600-10 TaxID=2829819 RepID=UPI001C479EF5|nr:PIG-L family deacetylase [Streptomyces sp. MW-W600-10]MBV7245847.1 PIG-L family deacetylase [Streptomyces sp. MW-W600-10]
MADVLAVSPHLDDAALSCGATLARWAAEGRDVLVYSAFAGLPEPPFPPAAQRFHELWQLHDDPVQARRAEDEEAMRDLGVTESHGPFLDEIYRDAADEADVERELELVIGRLIEVHRPKTVLTCSALGLHKDHVMARDATVRAAVSSGTPLMLWEDLPYGIWTRELPPLPAGRSWGPTVITEADADAWKTKTTAVARYVSQYAMLSYRETPIEDQLERHARTLACGSGVAEQVWTVV